MEDYEFFIGDDALHRFLIARENDEEEALKMWEKWIDWRFEFKPEKITEESISLQLKTGKAYLHGFDLEGRPCIVIKTALHFPDQSDFEEVYRFGIYMIEKASRLADDKKIKQIVCLIDREGVSMKNIDRRALGRTGLVTMMQDFYAERLHKIYILHINWLFRMMWNIVSVFLSKRTKSKIHVLSGIDELKKHFSEDNLLKEHGGKSDFVYKYPF